MDDYTEDITIECDGRPISGTIRRQKVGDHVQWVVDYFGNVREIVKAGGQKPSQSEVEAALRKLAEKVGHCQQQPESGST